MRELFLAEQKTLTLMAHKAWGIEFAALPSVLTELTEETGSSDAGNTLICDYVLEFVERPLPEGKFLTACEPILPNVVGADVFLTVEKATHRPLILETMNVSALSLDDLSPWIREFRRFLKTLFPASSVKGHPQLAPAFHTFIANDAENDASSFNWIRELSLASLAVLADNICFSLFAEGQLHSIPVPGERLTVPGRFDVQCYSEGSHIVLLSGWVRTESAKGEFRRMVV